ncbi:hypothetical protein AB37_0243 [Escherichia coli 8-415-05_S1_C2]|nr:hypothetical protein EC2016001_3495 [Escherichia coli 201600.1]KEN28681.1 hypothetical protein AB09_0241 [Escherichia coli 8-415-05_S1_C1]KEO15537.1 hypothetical protein AB37_0243 [Escherichia coli 8-415-05_S1_C2]
MVSICIITLNKLLPYKRNVLTLSMRCMKDSLVMKNLIN